MIADYPNSTRLQSLSQPKKNFCQQHPRSPYSLVSQSCLDFKTSDRLVRLSLPKIKKDNHVRMEFSRFAYDPTNSCVFNQAALRAECSDYIISLARPKSDYKGYQFAYPVQREISKSAKNATASERISKLSTPRIKKDNNIKEL
ncbi:unnamed protein product [Brachionus calyciflorus]|uniref:Uncharacterized protein n=1 Tax=Brachionus calyciflorus TaxID=104777 RepID=A0A813NDI9_9BILA|nr:unnamed protein product [Brachionus calyciflorus]